MKNLKDIMENIVVDRRRPVVIKIETSNRKTAMKNARLIVEKIEREMRIQRLEIAVKKLNLSRSWV